MNKKNALIEDLNAKLARLCDEELEEVAKFVAKMTSEKKETLLKIEPLAGALSGYGFEGLDLDRLVNKLRDDSDL